MESLDLADYRGAIALVGSQLEEARQKLAPHIPPPTNPLHITLLSKAENDALGRPPLPKLPLTHLHVLGVGSSISRRVQWLVVTWYHGEQYRKSLKLPPKDFHITLTDQDNHKIDKSIMSIDGGPEAIMRMISELTEEQLDHVLASAPTLLHPEFAKSMVRCYPESYKAYVRLADEHVALAPKIAMLSYARALSLNPALVDYVRRRLLNLSTSVLWGPIMMREELEHLESLDSLAPLLLQPWDRETRALCSDTLWTAPTESRTRTTYLGRDVPRFFTWLLPGRLAGQSTPRREADIDLLIDMGVTTVLTLTLEEPLDPAWFNFKPVKHIYVPIENYGVPTIAEMDIMYQQFTEDVDGSWLVHCGGGKGRAGTIIACILAMHDPEPCTKVHAMPQPVPQTTPQTTPRMSSTAIISELRRLRPGSIESVKQEKFIAEWVSHRWAVGNVSDVREPASILETSVNRTAFPHGPSHQNVEMCFLVGIPGSGKSWLAESIAKRRAAPTIVVSQDESRSRQACEAAIGRRFPNGTLILLDRCNPDPGDRRAWLSLVNSDKPPIVIFFDYEKELCRKRIDSRLGHPTIQAGRGANALKQMSAAMDAPSLKEGFGAVLTVSSFAAAREAVHLLGGPAGIVKFPRTAHLIDLGATTSDDIVTNREHLEGRLTVEEKIDGANMGFSLDWDGNIVVQNRSHYVQPTDHAQFKPLSGWLERHSAALQGLLNRDPQYPERYILYGEWVVAQHSIPYTHLPDRFLAFDLYDRVEKSFVSRKVLSGALCGTGIRQVPLVCEATSLSREQLLAFMDRRSEFYDGRIEGVYVRMESADGTKAVDRGKVVRGDFLAGNKHWSKENLRLNGIL